MDLEIELDACLVLDEFLRNFGELALPFQAREELDWPRDNPSESCQHGREVPTGCRTLLVAVAHERAMPDRLDYFVQALLQTVFDREAVGAPGLQNDTFIESKASQRAGCR